MLRFKKGVKVFGIQGETLAALLTVSEAYRSHNLDCIVTSCVEGEHSFASLHYTGCALDFRTRHVPEIEIDELVQEVRDALTSEYDVVLESTHLHVEFQPKRS